MRLLPLLLILSISATARAAWPQPAVERIANKSVSMAPPDLRLVVEKFGPEFREGLTVDDSVEGRHTFHVASGKGALRGMLKTEVESAIKMLRERQPMRDVVTKLGFITHLVADANNPFHVASSDPRLVSSQPDFEGYFNRKLSKFPTVFYGLVQPLRLEAFIDASLNRTASYYPLLSEEYFRFGERRTSAEFDDRSTGFGVASLCYSHAVTDVVNLYYYIWKEAGGDVRTASAMQRGNLLLNQ